MRERATGNAIFLVNDPQGRQITLLAGALAYIAKHPEMANRADIVEKVVTDPNVIATSKSIQSCLLYFRFGAHEDHPGRYVAVVVEHQYDPGRVITASLADNLSRGKVTVYAKHPGQSERG